MTGGSMPDPFAGRSDWAPDPPRPIAPTPATMSGQLRGRRVLIGLPGHGWGGGLRGVEECGLAGFAAPGAEGASKLVSMDDPPRRNPVAALDADGLAGRRVVQLGE